MKARVAEYYIYEIYEALPGHKVEECWHPDILAKCIDVPDNSKVGDKLDIRGEIAVNAPVDSIPTHE